MNMQEYKLKQVPEDFKVFEVSGRKYSDTGEYLIYSMEKKNYTTENAVQQISKSTRIPRKNFGYAGNKDSRAITIQEISIKSHNKQSIDELKMKDIKLTLLGHATEPISLGSLETNRFEITARNIEHPPKNISTFVNYFGEQRFSRNNSETGKLILKKKFKEAAELIMENSERDKDRIEEFLTKSSKDYVGALKQLPWKTLLIYIHSYQSYIWNKCAEEISLAMKGTETAMQTKIPLIGFATELDDNPISLTCSRIMEEEGIHLRDFIIRALPDLSSEGAQRNLYADIRELEIGSLEDDELNLGKKKCTLKFVLAKGCYATEAVKAMF